jgi:hypothetical protein
MKRTHLGILLVLLTAAFLTLAVQYAAHPSLYTVENDSNTPFHTNPEALKRIAQEKTDEVIPLMQSVLDSTSPVVLDIKLKNFEDARDELEEYSEKARYIDNLVINLDMSESDIGEFRRQNSRNLDSLEELLNNTLRIEDLNTLEIRYRDEKDPKKRYSVILEREALENLIIENFQGYASRSRDMTSLSETFELDSAEYLNSVKTFEEITQEIARAKQEREPVKLQALPYAISLSVTPQEGSYGDILTFSGTLTGPDAGGKPVDIAIDTTPWTAGTTDAAGMYSAPLRIERLREGLHFAYSSAETAYSPIVPFRVTLRSTNLTLDCTPGSGAAEEILCSGILSAGEFPVAGARVAIFVDEKPARTFVTGSGGSYNGTVGITEGAHVVQAHFSGEHFPLNGSVSPGQTVIIGTRDSPLVAAFFGAGMLILSTLGAVRYLRRKTGGRDGKDDATGREPSRHGPPREMADRPDITESLENTVNAPPADVLDRFHRVWDDARYGDAVHHLYCDLRSRIGDQHRISRIRVLTPRELTGLLAREPYAAEIAAFVSRYEQIYYGGMRPAREDGEMLSAAWATITRIMGRADR